MLSLKIPGSQIQLWRCSCDYGIISVLVPHASSFSELCSLHGWHFLRISACINVHQWVRKLAGLPASWETVQPSSMIKHGACSNGRCCCYTTLKISIFSIEKLNKLLYAFEEECTVIVSKIKEDVHILTLIITMLSIVTVWREVLKNARYKGVRIKTHGSH